MVYLIDMNFLQGQQNYKNHLERKKGIKYYCEICNAGPYLLKASVTSHRKVFTCSAFPTPLMLMTERWMGILERA